MKKKYIMLIAVVWALLVFSACGEKEEPENWFTGLHRLAVETIIERSEEVDGGMTERGEVEIVIDKIHPGSFTREDANEIFLNCWFKGLPHVAGLDSRAGILLNADTLEVIAYKEFSGDRVMLAFPRTAKGQSRILCLNGGMLHGTSAENISLWSVQDGQWEALPTGIADCVQYVKRDQEPFEIFETNYEIRIQNGCCYLDESMDSGYRLAVTCEYGMSGLFQPGATPPAELMAILAWNPYRECFELDESTVQPTVQQTQQDNNK